MSNISIGCMVDTTSPQAELILTIILDDQTVFEQTITEPVKFYHTLSDAEAEHELKFVLKNKRPEHTKIDSEGNIVEDACIVINNIEFDALELGQIVPTLARYTHDFNGTGAETQDKFYSHMGCNGTVSLKFTTPVYLWLLENM